MKNLLLVTVMFFTYSAAFSQLYVQPNGGADSYIYVTDEILFVEDDIELHKNDVLGTTKASIYLRNGSQLIQGTGTTLNSGDGYISIYQTAYTSNYHYNFWHSPVGNQDLNPNGNQNAGVSRIYEINDVTDSNLAGTTPLWNGDNDPLTISTRWIYKRLSSPANEQEANYIHVGGTDGIPTGFGFTMKGVSDGTNTTSNYEYDFRGRPNNGTINVPVNSGTQWTLSGNPYPSAIDLKDFFSDNIGNGLTGILFWDEPKDSEYSHYYSDKSGGYGVWLPGDPVAHPQGLYTAPTFENYSATGGLEGGDNGTGGLYDRRYSPVGQGFVLRTNSSGGNVTFSNSQRLFDNSVTEVRGQENENDPLERGSISQQLRINFVMDEEYARQLLLVFNENSTDGYDVGLDGHHPYDSGGAEAYFLIEENGNINRFVIQTLPFERNKKIPLGISLDAQTQITIKVVEMLNFNSPTWLWDSVNDTYQKLKANPNGNFDIDILLPAGEYDDRYYIVFKRGRQVLEESIGTLLQEEARANVDFFQNNPGKQLEVSNPDRYDIAAGQIFDMSGKLVIYKSNIGNQSNFTFSTANLSDGVYLVKLTTVDNVDIDYKMVIYN